MVATDLSQHLIDAGRRLLAALDEAGLQAQGAAWLFDHALGDWRFVVATSLVDSMGRLWVYDRILKVVSKLDMPDEVTMADIHLMGLNNPMYQTIGRFLRVEGGLATFKDCQINGSAFDGAVYRWGNTPTSTEAKKIERSFTRRIRELSG